MEEQTGKDERRGKKNRLWQLRLSLWLTLWGYPIPWQFVLNLAVQMFLWVTDFYSLEKIISVSPQIVLLYLKKKQLLTEREREGQRDQNRGRMEKGAIGGFSFKGDRGRWTGHGLL